MVELFDKDGNEIIDTDFDEDEHLLNLKRKKKNDCRQKKLRQNSVIVKGKYKK